MIVLLKLWYCVSDVILLNLKAMSLKKQGLEDQPKISRENAERFMNIP